MLESVFTVLGPITMEQIRDIGVDPTLFPELLARSTFNSRGRSDIQASPKTASLELRALLTQCLEYSPRRRSTAAALLDHGFFKQVGERHEENISINNVALIFPCVPK